MGRSRKPLGPQGSRGFESLLLRMKSVRRDILVTFLITVVVAHIGVWFLIETDLLKHVEPRAGGFRLHHITYGAFLALAAGYAGLAFDLGEKARKYAATAFGIGLGLFVDEVVSAAALQNKYWIAHQTGRISDDLYYGWPTYLVIGIVAAILLILATRKK